MVTRFVTHRMIATKFGSRLVPPRGVPFPSLGARAGAHCGRGADAAGRRRAMATATRPRAPVALERGRGRCVRRGPLVRRRVLRTSPRSAWCARRCGPSFRARDGCGAAWYATSISPSLAPRARPRGAVTRRARGRVPHRDPRVLAAPSTRVDRRMRWRGKCAAGATRRAHQPGALPDGRRRDSGDGALARRTGSREAAGLARRPASFARARPGRASRS